MDFVIETFGLQKEYTSSGKSKTMLAVGGVDLQIRSGEVFGILGPNGAGKTTTLEIIEGLRQQTSGKVSVLGLDNLQDATEIKRRIGIQLQSSSYLPSLTLTELINLFASIYGHKVSPDQLLGFVGLREKAGEYVKNLSGGQKQRFTIATTLINEPEVIFLDEPTTGLDPKARRDVWELIRQINAKGTTIVLTTHYMEEAEFLCSRVAIMDHGKILKVDDPKRLINDLAHTTQVSFLVDGVIDQVIWQPIMSSIEKIYSDYPKVILEIRALDVVGTIVEILKNHKISFSGFMVRTASLEDVYLDLTGKEYQSE